MIIERDSEDSYERKKMSKKQHTNNTGKTNVITFPKSRFVNEEEHNNGNLTPNDASHAETTVRIGGYQDKLYLEEDERMYKKVLKKLPYDPALDEFFISRKHDETESNEAWNQLVVPSITLDMETALPKAPSADESVIESEIRAMLERFIEEETSETVAKRIDLYYYHNMTVEEIADLEGVSLQTVAQSISNAIKRIRRRFRKAGYDVANV